MIARSIGDTVGYTFGILSQDADSRRQHQCPAGGHQGRSGRQGGHHHLFAADLPADACTTETRGGHHPQFGYLTALIRWTITAPSPKDTRIIYEFSTTKRVEPIKPNASITAQPFVVYCSGIDARNSDINIRASVT